MQWQWQDSGRQILHFVDVHTIQCCDTGLKIQGDSKILSGFSWPIIFKLDNYKTKLLMEYEIVTQRVLLFIDSKLQNAKFNMGAFVAHKMFEKL
jgi:hypothetical protein